MRQLATALLAGLALTAASGCGQDEEIRHYRVPRSEAPPARLLGAILPVSEAKVWFVKVSGPAPAVAELKPDFERFVASLRFPLNERRLVNYTLPDDWQREPSTGKLGRYETLRAGPNALDVTIHSFGRESADVLANVNRWRGQIGLKEITAEELPQVTRPLNVNGVAGTFVDVTGPGANTQRPLPPVEPSPAVTGRTPKGPAPGAKPLAYDTPPGWEELPAGGFRAAAFRVTDGGRKAEITVVPLGGAAGGLLANVNRWRQQLKLPEVTEEQVRREAKTIDVAGAPATSVDLLGPESAGAVRERTLAVIVPRGEQTWFFKMTGPAELVAKQQPAFETFVRSVRFGAGGK